MASYGALGRPAPTGRVGTSSSAYSSLLSSRAARGAAPTDTCCKVPRIKDKRQLALSVALVLVVLTERLAFKLMVDRLAPHRSVVMQLTLVLYLVVTAVVVAHRASSGKLPQESQGLPNGALFKIAILDTLHMVMMFEAATALPPPLTVILLQAAIPTTFLLSCRPYSRLQYMGAGLIALAVVVAMVPPTMSAFLPTGGSDGTSGMAQFVCSAVYLLSTVPAALSQLSKEQLVAGHGQPVDPQQMNLMLAAFQLALVVCTYPFIYQLQGLSYLWETSLASAPPLAVGAAWKQGWACCLLSRQPASAAPPPATALPWEEVAQCGGGAALLLVAPFVAASVAMGLCVEQLVLRSGDSRKGLRAVYRSLNVGVAAALCALGAYGVLWWPGAAATEGGWVGVLCTGVAAAALVAGLMLYRSAGDEPDDELFTSNRSPGQAAGGSGGVEAQPLQQPTAAQAIAMGPAEDA